MLHRIICSWCRSCLWVGCYIWYNEEGDWAGPQPAQALLAVPNVTNKQTNKHSPKQHLAGGHSCHHSSPSRHSAVVVLKQDDSKLYHESTIKCFVLSAEHYRHCWTALVETLLVDLLASLRSQTDRAILRVIKYFAKSLKATQNHSK